jgi:NADPH:quinone reductase
VKRGGIVCPIGTLIADEPTYDVELATAAGVTVIPTISNFANQPRQLRALVDAVAAGTLRVPAIEVLPLSEAGQAHRLIQAGHVRGKIVLEVNPALGA